jgi:hypothetical protein
MARLRFRENSSPTVGTEEGVDVAEPENVEQE